MKWNISSAVISRMGIEFKGHCYSCKQAIREQWFLKVPSSDEELQMVILYDPNSLDEVMVPIGPSWIRCFKLNELQRENAEIALYHSQFQTLRSQKNNLIKDMEGGH